MSSGSRAAALVAGAGLIAVWLAAAADRQWTPPAPSDRETAALTRAEQLAREIQSQSDRLRTRLATVPRPEPSDRNPFSLQASTPRVTRAPAAAATFEALATVPAEPIAEPDPLTLSGIAEEALGDGKTAAPVRTAVLSGLGDVFLARAGDTIASRYQVVLVGADAVELKDLTTGRTFRLGLR